MPTRNIKPDDLAPPQQVEKASNRMNTQDLTPGGLRKSTHPDPASEVLGCLPGNVAGKLDRAHKEYMLRRSGWNKPMGRMDEVGRWYPSDFERQECCGDIRQPSRKWPMGLFKHCTSMDHVALQFGVNADLLRALHRERNPAGREGGLGFYKRVSVLPDGTMVSLRDNTTVWALGETNAEAVRQEWKGGLFVYGHVEAAKTMDVPSRADAVMAPSAVIECDCQGSYVRYADENLWEDGKRVGVSKLAFSQVTPVKVVAADPLAATWLAKRRIFVQDGVVRP